MVPDIRWAGGDDIPISARLMAIADVYDALISRRCYKEPVPHETAVEMMWLIPLSQGDLNMVICPG